LFNILLNKLENASRRADFRDFLKMTRNTNLCSVDPTGRNLCTMLFLLFLIYSASAQVPSSASSASASGHCPGWTETCNRVLGSFAGVWRYNPPIGLGTQNDGLVGDSYVIYASNGYRFESTFLNYSGSTSQIQFSQVSQYQVSCTGYTANVLTTALALTAPSPPLAGVPVNGPATTVGITCNTDHLTVLNPPDCASAGVVSLEFYIDYSNYTLNFGTATAPYYAPHRWAKVSNKG